MGLARRGNEYEAYCFDEAVISWGNYVTSEVEKIEGKNAKAVQRKQARRLEQLLSMNESEAQRKVAAKKSFADPADMFK